MPKPYLILSALLPALFPTILQAQTFSGTGAIIPDDGTVLEIPLAVAGLPAPLDTASFGLEQICFSIDHPWLSDLEVSLVAPDGHTTVLVSGQGWDYDHYTNTCFRSDATFTVDQASPPYSGTFRSMGDLGLINNGQDGNGTWKLRVLDTAPFSDQGSVASWSITFGNDPAKRFPFHSSNLPIVVINTNGQAIPNDVKITAQMGIVDNGPGMINHPSDPFNDYNGAIGIALRGHSSQGMAPKKSYSVELRNGFGDDLNAAILGMPPESDWAFLANYFDKSLMNNTLTYHLARAMGDYAPRQRFVEVLLNGDYIGVYAVVEKIKRGPDRVAIAKLKPTDLAGNALTGGYILCVDWFNGTANGFTSPFPPVVSSAGQTTYFEYKYPKPATIAAEQKAYIQAYVDSFETALAGPAFMDSAVGYKAFADVPSFVDIFLINELSRNVDGYRLSSYLYKDKASNGGKLHAGPAWDYDIAWGNASYCDGNNLAGWAYDFGSVCPEHGNQIPFWWPRLQEDSTFVNAVRCRWNALRDNVLSPAYVHAYADSVAALLHDAQQRNFTAWPILGQYVWPNPLPIPTTYAGEVQELKDFMDGRWAWLDANLPGHPTCSSTASVRGIPSVATAPFPNPFNTEIMFRTTGAEASLVRMLDPLGRTVATAGPFSGQGTLHRIAIPPSMAPGAYILEVTGSSGGRSVFRMQH